MVNTHAMDSALTPDIPRSFLTSFPRAMLEDLAMGLDDDDTIAERYGATLENVTLLRTYPATKLELEAMRRELEANGRTFRFKAANMAHVTLERLFRIATDPDTPASTVLQIHDRFTKSGDLDPKPQQPMVQPGQGFQINIVMRGQTVTIGDSSELQTIQTVQSLQSSPPAIIDQEPAVLESPPPYLAMAQTCINAELGVE